MARPQTRQQLKNKREKERKKQEQKKKNQETLKDKLKISGIPGVKYTGSGKDPAVNELLKKLKKGGAGSLDSSGMGNRYKV